MRLFLRVFAADFALFFRGFAWPFVAASLFFCFFSVVVAAAAGEPRYPPIAPDATLEFPRDFGSHPAHRIEWWYVTGWLDDESTRERGAAAVEPRVPIGFQVTFFRVRPGLGEDNPSRFAPRQLLFAHAAVADPALGRLRHAERSAREGFDLAYAREARTDVRLDDWSLREIAPGRYRTVVAGADFSVALELVAAQQPLPQGDGGYSRKGPDPSSASLYYSLPQLAVHGDVVIDGRARRVAGRAWLDHEWSSEVLDAEAQGWDWVGVNFDDGGALMAFRMRDRHGGTRWAAATWRPASGTPQTFAPDAVRWTPLRHWRSPRTGARYPVAWRVDVSGSAYRLEPLIDDAELDSRASTGTIYWEGPVRVRSASGALLGRGYLELTGYGVPIRF